MKAYWGLLLFTFLIEGCASQEPAIKSFTLHRPSATSPKVAMSDLDKLRWSRGKRGEMIATAYITITNSQNPNKATAEIGGGADNIELCYRVPYYTTSEMPEDEDPDVAYAAAAFIVPIDFRVTGLNGAPERSAVSVCAER